METGSHVVACQVPVFRYALERWEPDPYRVVILHDSPLDASQQQGVQRLADAAQGARPINLMSEVIDPAHPEQASLRSLVPNAVPWPALILQYPAGRGLTEAAWVGTLNDEHAAAVVDSPLRSEIVRRLMAGHSAVWVLVESGDPSQDDAAATVLESSLRAAQTSLSLPDAAVLEKDEFYQRDTKVGLRLEFSWVRLRHDDPQEEVLRSVLRHGEPGLAEIAGPLAIAVYGRGRTHFALAGQGIHSENVEESCRFLVGACSCQVKAENPGIDLPLAAAWSEILPEITQGAATKLPELSGLGPLAELTRDETAPVEPQHGQPTLNPPSHDPATHDPAVPADDRMTDTNPNVPRAPPTSAASNASADPYPTVTTRENPTTPPPTDNNLPRDWLLAVGGLVLGFLVVVGGASVWVVQGDRREHP